MDQVSAYLADAFHTGGRVVSIAMPAHRRAFEARLAAAGIDLAAARVRDNYLAEDADEMLRQIRDDGRPDAVGFDCVVGSLIEGAVKPGVRTHVYSELVAISWDSGLVAAAIELEEAWIGLGRRFPFALCCGQRIGRSAGEEEADAFADLCRLHGEIAGPIPAGCTRPGPGARAAELSRNFSRSLDSVGSARRFVVATLEASGYGAIADDAALVVTELATNAVLHARSDFTVTVTPARDRVRIRVSDRAALPSSGDGTDPGLPVQPLHGLGAVAALAVRWGAAPAGSGKDVWAELRR
jgi:hypothetical protein